MKKQIKTLLLSVTFILFAATGFSQGPPPPPSGAGHGATGNQTGGNAPIGGGLFILMGLGAAYGGRKLYKVNKEEIED
jgi:hypothetical protein